MRTLLRPLGIAIVVWTGISMVALAQGTQAKQSATASKANSTDADAQHTLPSAHGSTLVTFKDAGPSKAGQIDPLDWPMWRGPEQNGISRETGLVDHFDLDAGENVLWTSKEAGGISTPVIMHGRLYTIVRRDPDTKREQECVVCLDAATGERLWESRHNLFLSGVPAERVGWSCVVADPETDRIYAQGVNGYFQCLEGATGKEIWSRSLLEEIGVLSVYGGRTNVPALFEDLVIAHSVVVGWGDNALPAHRFIAMDKNTGEVRWLNGTTVRPEDTIYSTPVMTVLDGEAAMVVPSADGSIWAIQPRTGKPIWNFRMSRRGINITPIIQDNIVYATQGEVNLDNRTVGSVVAINGVGHGDITATNAVWGPIKGIGAGKASPLLVDGRLYIGDDAANMYVFDAKTGKQIGRKTKLLGTMLNSSPVWADGRIYVMSVGALNVLEPAPNGLKVLSRTRLNSPLLIIGSPAISHGRIYLPTPTVLYCLGKKDQTPQATKRPEPPEENPIGDDTKPAWVQVSPVEVLLRPGEKQQFTVRLFNDHGQFLKESSAEFSVAGPGEINSQGQYTAPAGHEHSACIVTAKVGELTGKARLRVIPPLPWKFDFNDVQLTADSKTGRTEGEPPATWVGARYRHKVRDIDGERVMVKVTYIPKGTRSQLWFGHPDLKNYTVKADLKAATKDNRLPDMGLVAQRYTLDLMGQSQQLQIRSWPPQVATHLSKTVPLEWKANIWYTMKFQAAADPSGEKVVLRGKVWPREEKEPASWTVEVVDETPNFYGSPGLYGDATLAEIYIDNIEVTPNQTPDTGSTAANAPSAGKSVAAQSTARPAAAKANGAK